MKIIIDEQPNGMFSVTSLDDRLSRIQTDICRDEVIVQIAAYMLLNRPFYGPNAPVKISSLPPK